jgi:hypothetical protein
MSYRIGLTEGLDTRQAAGFEVVYVYHNGTSARWRLINVNTGASDTSIRAYCTADLINQQNVRSRMLEIHYPSNPSTGIVITSVQCP